MITTPKIIKKNKKDLLPAPYNPRVDIKKDSTFYQKLYASLVNFGYVEPIIWNKKTGFVVGGNQRLSVLMDIDEIQELDVVEVNLTLEKEKALNLALNKINGEWDYDLLAEVLSDLQKEDDLIDFTGFDEKEINEIINNFNLKEPGEEDYDVDEALQKPPKYVVKPGDVYQLSNHYVMCGDSTKKEDVEKLMDGKKVDMVFTDPPYGINIVKDNRQIGFGDGHLGFKNIGSDGADGIVPVGKHHKVIGDDTIDTAINAYNICVDLQVKNIIFWGGNYFANALPVSSCWLIWDKREGIPSNNFADCEIAYTTFKKPSRIYRHLWSGLLRKGNRKSEGLKRLHPTQKPVGLHANIITDFSKTNNSILDLFGGSGSTLIACEQTNRNCYMMELDPVYVSVILERWETLVNKKHKKVK